MRFMTTICALLVSLFTVTAFAAGSVTVTKSSISFEGGKRTRIVNLAWVGDASTGAVPTTSLPALSGFLMKVVTDPGATAPTANYDIVINSPDGDDAAMGALANRHTSNTEAAYPVTASGQLPVYFPGGTYSFVLSNNTVGGAVGNVKMYFIDAL